MLLAHISTPCSEQPVQLQHGAAPRQVDPEPWSSATGQWGVEVVQQRMYVALTPLISPLPQSSVLDSAVLFAALLLRSVCRKRRHCERTPCAQHHTRYQFCPLLRKLSLGCTQLFLQRDSCLVLLLALQARFCSRFSVLTHLGFQRLQGIAMVAPHLWMCQTTQGREIASHSLRVHKTARRRGRACASAASASAARASISRLALT